MKTIQFTKEEAVLRKDGTPVEKKDMKTGMLEWKLWNIWDENNVKYSVFGSMLDEAGAKVGDILEIDYIAEKQGKFTNNKITAIKQLIGEKTPLGTPFKAIVSPKNEEAIEKLEEIDDLGEILKDLRKIQEKVENLIIDSELPF